MGRFRDDEMLKQVAKLGKVTARKFRRVEQTRTDLLVHFCVKVVEAETPLEFKRANSS